MKIRGGLERLSRPWGLLISVAFPETPVLVHASSEELVILEQAAHGPRGLVHVGQVADGLWRKDGCAGLGGGGGVERQVVLLVHHAVPVLCCVVDVRLVVLGARLLDVLDAVVALPAGPATQPKGKANAQQENDQDAEDHNENPEREGGGNVDLTELAAEAGPLQFG